MPPNWRTDAAVWVNDQERGRIVAGSFGFVWWSGRKVFCASFDKYQPSPISAYKDFWEKFKGTQEDRKNLRVYDAANVTINAILRFVKSGLYP